MLACLAGLLTGVAGPVRAGAPGIARADYSLTRDPARQGFVVQGDASRFSAAPGQPLEVTLDSNDAPGRLLAPLSFPLDGSTSFTFTADFTLHDLAGSPVDFFQVALGLVDTSTTGLERTGTALPGPPWFLDNSNVWNCVELDYFPNVTSFGGPFLQPTVFGGNVGSPFANFAANFGPSTDLGDNPPDEIRELPQETSLRAVLAYDACTQVLTTRMFDLSGGKAAELATGLQPLDVSFVNATSAFHVDAVAVNAYHDSADSDPSTESLTGRLAVQSLSVVRYDGPDARLEPASPSAGGQGTATVRVVGWVAAPPAGSTRTVRAVSRDGVAEDVPLLARGAGAGTALVQVPRSALGTNTTTIDLAGCLVEVTWK